MSRYETQLRSEQLAAAYVKLARANDYMVGIVETVTLDERNAAEQILITHQNRAIEYSRQWKVLGLAIDILENDRLRANRA